MSQTVNVTIDVDKLSAKTELSALHAANNFDNCIMELLDYSYYWKWKGIKLRDSYQ